MAHAQKTQITQWFSGKSFEKQIWDEGCRVCDLLVDGELTGWFFQECQLSTFMIPTNVQLVVLSLKLPSSTWMAALVPVEQLKDICPSFFFFFNF